MSIKQWVFTCSFLLSSVIYADWSTDFDQVSSALVETFPKLRAKGYREEYAFFSKAREQLLVDAFLCRTLGTSQVNDKFMIFREKEKVVCKKRRNSNIKEFIAWELSFLAGAPNFVVPAMPVLMGDKQIVMQKMETFTTGEEKTRIPPRELLRNISLETYWKAHLIAYIFAMRDLAGRNIGVNSKGQVRFFDNEYSFLYENDLKKGGASFCLEFASVSFDWPQYRLRLDSVTALKLQEFIRQLDHFEEDLSLYLQYRPFEFSYEGLLKRLKKVRSFSFKEGESFRDFYAFLFPNMSSGLDDLNDFVGQILKRKVDHGTSLFFIFNPKKVEELKENQKKAIRKWISQYVE